MWKIALSAGGVVAGSGLAAALVQFPPIWVHFFAGLLVGNLGLLLGFVLDARALTRTAVLGWLGFLLGIPLGGLLVWFLASFQDTFSGGGLAGIFFGAPLGALFGSAVGLLAGGRYARSPSKRLLETQKGGATGGDS